MGVWFCVVWFFFCCFVIFSVGVVDYVWGVVFSGSCCVGVVL